MSLHPRVLRLHQFVDPNELSRSRAIPTPNDAENGTKRPDHDFPLSPASLHRKIRWGGFGEGGPFPGPLSAQTFHLPIAAAASAQSTNETGPFLQA